MKSYLAPNVHCTNVEKPELNKLFQLEGGMCPDQAHTQPGTEKARNVELNFQFNLVGASPVFFFSVITLMGKILFYKAWVEMNMTKPFLSKVLLKA